MNELQELVFSDPAVRAVTVQMVDPFGQPIFGGPTPVGAHEPPVWKIDPYVSSDQGGAWQMPALMDALDITEIVVPFNVGPDQRAPYAFRIRLVEDSRVKLADLSDV